MVQNPANQLGLVVFPLFTRFSAFWSFPLCKHFQKSWRRKFRFFCSLGKTALFITLPGQWGLHPIYTQKITFMIQKGTLGALGFCIFCFFMFFPFFHFHLSICPKSQGKPKRNKKNNPVRRIWSKSIPDCFFFLVYLVFLEVFAVPSPTVQKLEENQKKTKKTKKPILWEESWVSPFRIVFFVFFGLFGFSRGFCCPKPNCPKTRGKQKKTKKQSCEKNLG